MPTGIYPRKKLKLKVTRGLRVNVVCFLCKKIFTVVPSRSSSARFCEQKCFFKWKLKQPSPLKGRKVTEKEQARLRAISPFKQGYTPWNKGRRNPEISGSKHPFFGKKHSILTRQKMRKAALGKKTGLQNHNWGGGRNKGTWRRRVLELGNFICQHCGIDDPRVLTVDHIKSKALYPELKFEVSNGMVLCANCHLIKTKEDTEVSQKISRTAKKTRRIRIKTGAYASN